MEMLLLLCPTFQNMGLIFSKRGKTSFELIYRDTFDQSFGFALRLTKNQHIALDIVQQCYLKLWENFENQHEEEVRKLLFTFIKNMFIDLKRKENTRLNFSMLMEQQSKDLSDETALTILEKKEVMQAIADAIEELPEQRKIVYKLSREKDLSHDEIARTLAISKHTVNNHIVSATQFLRTRLKVYRNFNSSDPA
jgi:RNA polymerase sigma-70 factor (family 1)